MGIQTIQDVRDMLRKGHPNEDKKGRSIDALHYLWRIHRNGKNESEPLKKHYGLEYARSSPYLINENNLTLSFEEFSTDELIKISNGISPEEDLPRNLVSPVVIVKFRNNFHLIDGNRRIRYWHLNNIDGPHRACVLTIKE